MEMLSVPPSSISTNSILCKCTRRFAAFPFMIIILIFLVLPAAGDTAISYSAHCGDFVQEAPLLPNPNPPLPSTKFLSLRQAHVECRGNDTSKGISVIPRSLSLSSHKAYRTQNDAVFRIEAVVTLIGVEYSRNSTRRGLRLVHIRPPRIPVTPGDARKSNSFSLNGFWDSISGKLCMIGSGFGVLSSAHVVLKLDYLNSSSIFTSLANGTLESLDVNNESGYNLKSISILGVNLRDYKYELIDKEIENNGFRSLDDMTNVSLRVEDLGRNVCKYIRTAGALQLDYKSDCNSVNCNFLGGRNHNFMPSAVYFKEIECLEDGRVRFLLVFGDFRGNGYWLPFEPNVTLVTEGKWDMENRRLNMVGCRIFSDWDEGLVGECLIRLSLRFPARWTLRDRSAVVGELWSSRRVNESGYFARVTLASIKNTHIRSVALGYDYTEIENTRRSCANKIIKKAKEGKYPNALSSDMRFDMVVGNRKVRDFWGYSSPLFVGNQLYRLSNVFGQEDKYTLLGTQNLSNVINVSYVLSLSTSRDFKLSSEFMQIKSFEISAEGIYDSKSGHLCMTGCMHVGAPKVRLRENSSLDCEVLVDIQYPPLRASNVGIVKGTIESTRAKYDRLYFEPFEIFSESIYAGQAKESIWRMDLEFTMVLISNTLSCIFMGLQLLHVKRHADVLPFISIIMLIVLTLAHMVPLLLNFEALFRTDRNNVNVYFGSDGWVEVNEVLVRVITMIAFLLEFRLLQMAWSARSGDESQKNLWVSDKKVLYISLPMYIGGGLIAWFAHLSKKSRHSPSLGIHHLGYKQLSLWGDLKSYAGLTLDGFLLPQILFNLFSDAKEKALAPSFYIGATFIRLLPHAYDLYRSHSSSWSFNYIYANPRMDYYSTTWDIIISVGGLSFVVLVYLQQWYGGRCLLLPMRFWPRSTYEKVPVGNTV
ncbi:hypothetical protein BUALT_Bualt03G0057300 [Buddleja alternifolia]|uniref:RING-type E3 ubiquitin transferase n=1 Tax=Buddleja alternifolia TaxID=168488 RepID=A0AAV6XSL9_9LAMI|nr:hypothetical protein BUALT_Bualt03G0057300 [Buddleja alternifolia]